MSDTDLQQLAMALGRVPSGLFILTATDGQRETGLLASWVQQCSFEPPQVTFAVKRGRDVLGWLGSGSACTLNLIADGHTKYLSHFGKGFALHDAAFTGLNVERLDGEAPILADALAHLRCRVNTHVSCGDHELVIATVVGGRLHQEDGKPMVHVRKNGLRY